MLSKIAKKINTSIQTRRIASDVSCLKGRYDNHILLVCSPKSGSTWLSKTLENTLDWKTVKLVPAFGNREQEIDISRFYSGTSQGKVFTPHMHLRYSEYTNSIIEALNTKVVVQVRNIFDTVISFYDHIEKEGPSFPAAYMDGQSWAMLSEDLRWSYLVDLVIPWYFNFYCGWYSSPLNEQGRLKFVTYEQLLSEPKETVSAVLSFAGEGHYIDRVEGALEEQQRKNTRKNKGVTGRGNALPDELKQRIISYTKYYPFVDFSLLGLGEESQA